MANAKEVTPFDELKKNLDKMAGEFAAVLPDGVKVELFVRVLKSAISRDRRLLEADRHSLYDEALKCAQDGLVPDGREAVLNVFKNRRSGKLTVKYIPMIEGLHKRARNSGEISFVDAQVVYEKDEYDSWTDENGPHFRFKRARGERGKPLLTFACAKLKSGAFYMEEVDESQMADIESVSAGAGDSAWKGKFKSEMKRKSAFRRLYKRLPSSSDLDTIMKRDDDMFDLGRKEKPEGPKPKSRVSGIVGSAPLAPDPKPEPEQEPEGQDGQEPEGQEEETPI